MPFQRQSFRLRAGFEPRRVVAYKPLLDGALALTGGKPTFCVILQRAIAPCALIPERDHDMAELVAAAKNRGHYKLPV